MTVEDLIAELQKLPPDAQKLNVVHSSDDSRGYVPIGFVHDPRDVYVKYTMSAGKERAIVIE